MKSYVYLAVILIPLLLELQVQALAYYQDDPGVARHALEDLDELESSLLRQVAANARNNHIRGAPDRDAAAHYRMYEDDDSMAQMRQGGRRNFRKRNYNLDHLARMNFRRSFRASKFNNRHILGGLKK